MAVVFRQLLDALDERRPVAGQQVLERSGGYVSQNVFFFDSNPSNDFAKDWPRPLRLVEDKLVEALVRVEVFSVRSIPRGGRRMRDIPSDQFSFCH